MYNNYTPRARKKPGDERTFMPEKKIVAITAEYNPLHNGHLKLIERAKALSPDILLVILNGSFLQRGSLAILDKYTRAKHALLAGADAVVELPQIFGAACAERFADGAVKLLAGIPASERILAFGAEEANAVALENAAKILEEEPLELQVDLKELMDMGLSYPTALAETFARYAESKGIPVADVTKPNNILAVEYLRAIKRRGGVTPLAIKREGEYDAETIDAAAPSAAAIRKALAAEERDEALSALPPYVASDLEEIRKDDLSPILLYRLTQTTKEELAKIADVREGIENRILRLAKESGDAESLVKAVSTKRYTEARVRRILVNALLGVTDEMLKRAITAAPYYKVLGVKADRTDVLSVLSRGGVLLTGENEAAESGIESAAVDCNAYEIYRVAKGLADLKSGMILV